MIPCSGPYIRVEGLCSINVLRRQHAATGLRVLEFGVGRTGFRGYRALGLQDLPLRAQHS